MGHEHAHEKNQHNLCVFCVYYPLRALRLCVCYPSRALRLCVYHPLHPSLQLPFVEPRQRISGILAKQADLGETGFFVAADSGMLQCARFDPATHQSRRTGYR